MMSWVSWVSEKGCMTIRSIFGRASASPAFTAHQLPRRSTIFCVGDENTTFHGPVVTGQPFARSKCLNVVQSLPLKMCFGTISIPMSYLYVIYQQKRAAVSLQFIP